jgi:hypothetical protein
MPMLSVIFAFENGWQAEAPINGVFPLEAKKLEICQKNTQL